MKPIDYFYNTTFEGKNKIIFECPSCYHIGDKIGILNMHLYYIKKYKLSNVYLNISGIAGDDLILYTNLFKNYSFTNEPSNIKLNVNNDFEYFKEVFTHKYNIIELSKKDKSYITYSFSCNTKKEEKTPEYINNVLQYINNKFSEKFKIIEVGKHLSIDQVLEYMNNSLFFIGLDNGMSHLCRCLDTSHIMIEHKFPLSYAFPTESYDKYIKCNSLEETKLTIDKFNDTIFLQ